MLQKVEQVPNGSKEEEKKYDFTIGWRELIGLPTPSILLKTLRNTTKDRDQDNR
jgi:hypothetical protein